MTNVSHKRVAKNTLLLYCRLLLTVGVSLFTVRIVLGTLGVEDYGVYNVVGGLVALLAFLPAAMASATQRFFSFALGAKDEERLRTTFSVNFALYSAIAITALLLLETAGAWYVREHLRLPADRLDGALALYHFSVLTFTASIFTSPFMAIIIAHEDMKIYAYVSIVEAVLKLTVAYLLTHLAGDKLSLYGSLLLGVAIFNASLYIGICTRKYSECQFRIFHWNKSLLREILGFTGWTLFGQLTTAVRNHAVTILLNQMFNPTVVAARAIAVQVGAQTNLFSANFNTSLYPPIVKSYAAGRTNEMYSLILNGCKITFFLMWILALPLLLEMEAVLTLWLKNPPADSVLYARLALVETLITSVSLPLMTAARASGKMRLYELTLGAMQLTILPLAWSALKASQAPWTVFAVAIAVNALMFVVRLFIVNHLVGLPAKAFLGQVGLSISAVVCVSSAFSLGVASLLPNGLLYSATAAFASLCVSGVCIYFWGLNAEWREKLRAAILKKTSSWRKA